MKFSRMGEGKRCCQPFIILFAIALVQRGTSANEFRCNENP